MDRRSTRFTDPAVHTMQSASKRNLVAERVDLLVLRLHSWWHGLVVSGVRRTNEVNARQAQLVPGWVTVFGRVYHLGM